MACMCYPSGNLHPEHSARWMAVALAMAMFEGGLSDATPIIPAMFQAWAML